MGSFSNYTEANVLDAIFKIKTFEQANNLTIALSTTDPTDDGSGISEPIGNGYVRVTFNGWGRVDNVVSNISIVTFEPATGPWGIISHFAIFDDALVPNIICSGAVTPNQEINAGNIPSFDPGILIITLD